MNLTPEQEKIFWDLIARNIGKKLAWEYPFKCTETMTEDLQDDLEEVLYKLCDENPAIYKKCKLAKNGSTFKGYPMRNTIYSLFPFNKKGGTRLYIKNRFTYYLYNKNAEKVIESIDFSKEINQKLSTHGNPRSETVKTQEPVTNFLLESVQSFVNTRKYSFEEILDALERYKEQENIQNFKLKFKALHEKMIDHLMIKKDIQTGMKIYMDIYALADRSYFKKEDGEETSIFSHFGGFGFHLRDTSISERIKKYLALDGDIIKKIEVLQQVGNKNEQAYYSLFRLLLDKDRD